MLFALQKRDLLIPSYVHFYVQNKSMGKCMKITQTLNKKGFLSLANFISMVLSRWLVLMAAHGLIESSKCQLEHQIPILDAGKTENMNRFHITQSYM